MTEILFLGVFTLGSVLTGLLVVPLWREDRDRLEARVNDLLRLLEAKAAPAEVAAFLDAPAPDEDEGSWIFTEDGLVGTEVVD